MNAAELEKRISKLQKLEVPVTDNVVPELKKLGIHVETAFHLGGPKWIVTFGIPATNKAHVNASIGATFALKALTGGPVEVTFCWKEE